MKRYLIYTLILTSICFISFLITYGYEEGTMRNQYVGKIFSSIFQVFKFPLAYVFSSKYILISLIINIFLLPLLVTGHKT